MIRAFMSNGVFRSIRRIGAQSFSSSSNDGLRVCIVGTGPAGFYTAKYLLKGEEQCHIDLIEALPTPFGLVRSGVAPDHPEVKSVINDFTKVVHDPRVCFFGNVHVGRDIAVEDLLTAYDAVVLSYGAESDRELGIPGENLDGVLSARAFVNWYNGHPNFKDLNPCLDVEDVVIIGQGNVSLDCARILCKTPEELQMTDISQHALEALSASKVKRVHVLGRRGHVQAAFTMKELREVTKLPHAECFVLKEEFEQGRTAASEQEIKEYRPRKRMDALIETKCTHLPSLEDARTVGEDGKRGLIFRFLRLPFKILPASTNEKRIGSLVVERMRLEGEWNQQRAVGTKTYEEILAGMLLRSIGYKSLGLPGVPFDDRTNTVPNDGARVLSENGTAVSGLYCAGWLKRGPSGIIGTNISDARQTVDAILEDYSEQRLHRDTLTGSPHKHLEAAIERHGKPFDQVITWEKYQKLDQEEIRRGNTVGKPREKITSIEEMLHIANKVE